jgi:DNA replicative helicase MCM subunit Mcm2 (Cdc46/Mcm family)
MTDKAAKLINDFYLHIKTIEQREGSIRINKRFFESVYRVATAITKLHLKNETTAEYAMMAIEIIKQTLQTFRMNTEKEGVVMSLETHDDSAKTAFRHCWRTLETELKNDYIPEHRFLEKLVAEYNSFKDFKNLERAQAYFDKMYNAGKITKSNGLYKLL